MTEKKSQETTLILGIGNIVMSDEGFGVHVVRQLKEMKYTTDVRIEEGGVGGFNLLGSLEGIERLIVVDVMMADIEPGEVLFFKPGPDFGEPGKNMISFHQVGVLELVKMRKILGYELEVYFLVTRPEKLAWGMELSPPTKSAADKAVQFLRQLLRDNFSIPERSISSCSLQLLSSL